jgi:hypothetical protein
MHDVEDLKPKDGSVETISELVADGQLFDSKGFTIIKITKDGVGEKKRLPIKSTGVAEFQEKLSGKAPKPPQTFQLIKKDSKEGREIGLKKHDKMHIVQDDTDEDYIDALEKHTQDFLWQIAVFALDIKWKKSDGTEAQTFDEKKEILKSNNITGHHIDKIYNDVILLTQFEEDRQDFLSRNS